MAVRKLLTCVVPCYNSAAYMERAVDSLLAGGEEMEVLIVDDGSTDSTGEIADRLAAAYPSIVKAHHQENGGHGSALNYGMAHAEGIYFKVVDSDDRMVKENLPGLMDLLRKHADPETQADMVFHDYVYDCPEKENTFQAEEAERKTTQAMQNEVEHIRGREENYAQMDEQIAADLARERSVLDHWIHNFNLHNPPVQYAELEDVFSEGKDWNALREQLRRVHLDFALCQARVDGLNSRLVALQAEGGRNHVNEDEMQASIISQREDLEEKRTEIMLQIARFTIALEEHEKATKTPSEPLA